MKEIKVKFRHEIKHYINIGDYFTIRSRLKHIAKTDANANTKGEYIIRSIYFDNYNDTILGEKLAGLNNRDKFRIRFYNHDSSFIRLEKKSKTNGLCSKKSAPIAKEQCEMILSGDFEFLRDSDSPLLRELYLKSKQQLLRPKTIVDYVREAYIYEPGNVRITFDRSVRTGLFSRDIFNPSLPTVETMDNRCGILEVKYDEYMPQLILDLIQTNERRASAISKYALCRRFDIN